MNEHKLYLDLGPAAVCLSFPFQQFADRAIHQIFLNKREERNIIGEIRFVEDNAIQQFSHPLCKPNNVYIKKNEPINGRQKITLRIFDEYTIVLNARKEGVTVRYPADAPFSLLLDDVLQAALHWIIESVGGFLLHGSCVVRDNVAMAIMGISGAGKSTTAFNLTRLGFKCYADDAVLVVPMDGNLTVRPFTREISIRPLTFRLLQEHGVQISDYRKDGEKYFFNPGNDTLAGANLKYACLVEVSGEKETTIKLLGKEQFRQALIEERKHFTFMGRESAEIYAGILSKHVPIPIYAAVGADLDMQGRAFDSVFKGLTPSSAQSNYSKSVHAGRDRKKAIIRAAWSDPEQPPIAEILPLLGDFDLKILKLAFSFFQTLPMGKFEPVGLPSSRQECPGRFEAGWLQAAAWLDGCRMLVEQSRPEVFQKFAFPWIKSAPLIYPFLAWLTSSYHEKYQYVQESWIRYMQNPDPAAENANRADFHVLCFQGDQKGRTNLLKTLNAIGEKQSIIVIPVIDRNADSLAPSIEMIQLARENGFRVRLSRHVPLCTLDEAQADLLFQNEAIEMSANQGLINASFLAKNRIIDDARYADFALKDIHKIVDDVTWYDKPYHRCLSCGCNHLGLCKGGVFRADRDAESKPVETKRGTSINNSIHG